MTRAEFVEMVEWIEDHWGRDEVWANAGSVYADFAEISADDVWESLVARVSGDPEKAKWPPKPPELRALALEKARRRVKPALPETTERWTWAEYSQREYGELVSIGEAIRRRVEAST